MAKTVKYVGSQDRWAELPVTGSQSAWRIGQQEERPDDQAVALLSTGLFSLVQKPWEGGASATSATITGSFAVGGTITATLPAGTLGTLQFTRTMLTAPFTKSNISGAVASAVNSLSYIVQTADRNCSIDVDVSNVVVASRGGAVPITAPLAPTITNITAGDGSVTVTLTRNADNGGDTVTGDRIYVWKASDNSLIGSANGASPITLAGIPNGVPVYATAATIGASKGVGPQSPASATATPAAAPQTLRTIATQNRPPNASESRGVTRQYFRAFKRIGSSDVNSIVWAVMGNKFSSNGYQALPNDYTIGQMATVSPLGVVAPAFNSSGGRSLTVAAGTVSAQFAAMRPSDFGLTKFTVGDVYEVRGYVDVPNNTGQIPYSNDVFSTDVNGTQFMWCDPAATSASAVDAAGAFVFTGTAPESRTVGFIPLMLGTFVSGDPRTRLMIGSSSYQGTGDTRTGTTVGTLGRGMAQLSCADADGISNPTASINLGAANTTASKHKLNLSLDWLATLCNSCDILLGSNDVPTSGASPSLASIQSDMTDIITRVKAAGVAKIVLGLPQPRTEAITNYPNGSNDLFVTVAGQNIPANYDVGGTLSQLDDWLKGRVTAGVAAAYYDNLSCRAGTNPAGTDYWRWVVNGTANYPTTDGTHRTTPLCITSAAEIRAVYAGL